MKKMNVKTRILGLLLIMAIVGSSIGVGALVTLMWTSPILTVETPPPPTKLNLIIVSNFIDPETISTGNTFEWTVVLSNPNDEQGYDWTATAVSLNIYKGDAIASTITDVLMFQYSNNNGVSWSTLAVYPDPESASCVIPLGTILIPSSTDYPIICKATFVTDGLYHMAATAQFS